eukprot:CAMPEP_0119100992 /NCGR_PEP_ID=MMETSP1180-20130426/111_1 /TAXON_ID=3052 ORGANISM="Chlamydomonas cf sp, Strain CCMP681" /NCGR_SAMPLE_ID=MMETSP1180 /ASSEMBLY_ACC=CAM_ASM_000741 /LENGTH=90 /DNA_ID=CAMNT_0007084995 /DNA_START=191 /DNA_END=459 /DNA_ORIENTATION=-
MSHPLFDNLLVKLDQELANLELQLKRWTPRGTAEGASASDRKFYLSRVEAKAMTSKTRRTVVKWLNENPVTQTVVEPEEAQENPVTQTVV